MQSLISSLFIQKPIVFVLRYDSATTAFYLHTEKMDKLCPINKTLSNLNLSQFPVDVKETDEIIKLKPREVGAVRNWLSNVSKTVNEKHVVCEYDQVANAVKQIEVPRNFMLSFSTEENGIFCMPSGNVISMGDGWFLSGSDMWYVKMGNASIQSMRGGVSGQALAELLSKDIPDLIKRGIRVDCPFCYDGSPYLYVTVKEVTKDAVSVRRENLTGGLRPVRNAPSYVWDGNILRPRQEDALMERFFANRDDAVLTGDDIPELAIAARDQWKTFLSGDVEQLLEMHTVYEDAELLLCGFSEEHNGIGKAYARVELWSGKRRFSAAALSRSILPGKEFVQADDGWFSVKLLVGLGLGPMGRLNDGRSLEKPFALEPQEIISLGSARLSGPWKRMVIEEMDREQPGKSMAYSQLCFLTKWGLSGGISGNFAENMDALLDFVRALYLKAPACRTLMIGKKERMEEIYNSLLPISPLWLDGGKKDDILSVKTKPFVIATSNAAMKDDILSNTKFDILIMVEPEGMAKTSVSKTYKALNKMRATLRIALYLETGFEQNYNTAFIQHDLLKMGRYSVPAYHVIDTNTPLVPLPEPYAFESTAVNARQIFAEVKVPSDAEPTRSVPIPPREAQPQPQSFGNRPQINLSFQSGEQLFVAQAHKLSDRTVGFASFVPFMTYWPTYGSMTSAQLQWYFYWRCKVRSGEYPDTDLSYIFLYVYELINLAGCRSPFDGYQKLLNVWCAYRARFPKLDGYLTDWVSDFVLLHRLHISADEISKQVGCTVSRKDIDQKLIEKLNEKPVKIEVPLLSQAANYDLTRSKFYQSANAFLCDEYVPKAVALVDAFLEKQQGRRIIEMFNPGLQERERYLFSSALYAGDTRTIRESVIPLSSHQPLRDFLAQVIRHTENKLREIKNFPGKLRGIELEEELGRLIDAYLERELLNKPQPKPGIIIDAQKLARAEDDAEQTKRMLMTDNYEETSDEQKTTEFEAKRSGTSAVSTEFEQNLSVSDGLPTDLAPVAELLSLLDDDEKLLIDTLASRCWELDANELQTGLPHCMAEEVIDRINEKALRTLGSLLIVHENQTRLVDEDYRDELEYLQSNTHASQEHAVWNTDKLDEAWKEFFLRLTPYHIDMLAALAKDADWMTLQTIAEQVGTMVELVIDGINEASMETIGDILIQDGAILNEYLDTVKALFSTEDKRS